ncbi:MAG: hypothetical protein Q8L23_15980 [Caulobacter sp.]|nr:hypothetical protein [Caulobacter sp.]
MALAARKAAGFVGKHWKLLALVGVLAFAGVQTHRVGRLKADVAAERAAQINPATKKAWKVEAQRDARDLTTCRGNTTRLEGSLAAQTAAVRTAEAEGDRMAAAAARAARDARAARVVAESRSRAILDTTIDAATCEGRDAQLLDLAAEAVG